MGEFRRRGSLFKIRGHLFKTAMSQFFSLDVVHLWYYPSQSLIEAIFEYFKGEEDKYLISREVKDYHG